IRLSFRIWERTPTFVQTWGILLSLSVTGMGSLRASKIEAARAEELHQLRVLRRVGLFAVTQSMLGSYRSKRQHAPQEFSFPKRNRRVLQGSPRNLGSARDRLAPSASRRGDYARSEFYDLRWIAGP